MVLNILIDGSLTTYSQFSANLLFACFALYCFHSENVILLTCYRVFPLISFVYEDHIATTAKKY